MRAIGNISLAAVVAVSMTAHAQLASATDAGTATGRYTYTSSSLTVTDVKTGLIWQRADGGLMTQAAAKTYCTNAAIALGATGWRLPTIKELLTLVDYDKSASPHIDQAAFPATLQSTSFWSSSLALFDPASFAWNLDFSSGGTGATKVSFALDVRCVR